VRCSPSHGLMANIQAWVAAYEAELRADEIPASQAADGMRVVPRMLHAGGQTVRVVSSCVTGLKRNRHVRYP
jgi:hypothetical protein